MPNVIRIKRRASGNAGAPAALKSAELAHNEVDNTLYVGKGDDGSGNATSIVALAGVGAFADLSTTQTVGGAKTFSIVPKSSQDASASTDLVRKSQFDTALTGKASTTHSHAIGEVTGLQTALDGKAAASTPTWASSAPSIWVARLGLPPSPSSSSAGRGRFRQAQASPGRETPSTL